MIGSQQVLEPYDIGPPDYEVMDWEIEETIELLLERAVETGEMHSQAHHARTGNFAPFAHRATTSYHAIDAIRLLQAQLAAEKERYAALLAKTQGDVK